LAVFGTKFCILTLNATGDKAMTVIKILSKQTVMNKPPAILGLANILQAQISSGQWGLLYGLSGTQHPMILIEWHYGGKNGKGDCVVGNDPVFMAHFNFYGHGKYEIVLQSFRLIRPRDFEEEKWIS
jgi:hypothetical protein